MNCFIFLLLACRSCQGVFNEKLKLTPLRSGHVLIDFTFEIESSHPSSSNHSREFPRLLNDLLEKYGVHELHFSLAGGSWNHKLYGRYPTRSSSGGAELWAWIGAGRGGENVSLSDEVDSKWYLFSNSLSGLTCASLNFASVTNRIVPMWSFRPSGVMPVEWENESEVRYSSLPGEVICTENLTPWLKFLPCKGNGGLAKLINPGGMTKALYRSIYIDVFWDCGSKKSCANPKRRMQLGLSMVTRPDFDVTKNNVNLKPPLYSDWKISSFFNMKSLESCPLSDSSRIYIAANPKIYTISEASEIEDGYYKFEFENFALIRKLALSANADLTDIDKETTPISISSYISGSDQEKASFRLLLTNNCKSAKKVILLQQFPWYLRIFLHTLHIDEGADVVQKHIQPAKDRKRPYHIELLLLLKANSKTTISINFHYRLIRFNEYPPDAYRGFDITPAVLTVQNDGPDLCNEESGMRKFVLKIYSNVLTVILPTPDFSMPYNVICLSCTVVALGFGPIHQATTKVLNIEPGGTKSKLRKILDKLMCWKKVEQDEDEINVPVPSVDTAAL